MLTRESGVLVGVGRRLGLPESWLRAVARAGSTRDETDFAAAWPTIASAPKLAVPWTAATLDRAFLDSVEERRYFRRWYGDAVYERLWRYLYDLAQVDPRLRRNADGRGGSAFFAAYPPRVPPTASSDVEIARLSRTDAYPPGEFPGVRPLTREFAQFLWNRLVAEHAVPPTERRDWWRGAFVLACKLMDDSRAAFRLALASRASSSPQSRRRSTPRGETEIGTATADEAGVEEAMLLRLGDPWRGFLVDPATERRKGRAPPFLLDTAFAPEPAVVATPYDERDGDRAAKVTRGEVRRTLRPSDRDSSWSP